MSDNADILRELARAKVAFQLRAIETVIRGGELDALAALAREGGDAQQAPAESPQSGPPQEGNAQ